MGEMRIAKKADKLKMFEFVFRNHETEEDGEEYVVSDTVECAIDVLNRTYEKDELVVSEYDFNEINIMDNRKSIQFECLEKPIKVSKYIEENNQEHFVGSSNPNFGVWELMIESKRFI